MTTTTEQGLEKPVTNAQTGLLGCTDCRTSFDVRLFGGGGRQCIYCPYCGGNGLVPLGTQVLPDAPFMAFVSFRDFK